MEFRIVDAFTDSLGRLTGKERKEVKTSAFDLRLKTAQRQWVEENYSGPARVCGSATTGKTIVALYRAVLSDVDGNIAQRVGTISIFNGPRPTIQVFGTPEDERHRAGRWLLDRGGEGVMSHEMGVFVRSPAERDRARAVVEHAGLPFKVLDENVETTDGYVSISTMHLSKGLGFARLL